MCSYPFIYSHYTKEILPVTRARSCPIVPILRSHQLSCCLINCIAIVLSDRPCIDFLTLIILGVSSSSPCERLGYYLKTYFETLRVTLGDPVFSAYRTLPTHPGVGPPRRPQSTTSLRTNQQSTRLPLTFARPPSPSPTLTSFPTSFNILRHSLISLVDS